MSRAQDPRRHRDRCSIAAAIRRHAAIARARATTRPPCSRRACASRCSRDSTGSTSRPETVLDLGCGTGHGAAALAARWPSARVIALDASPGDASRGAPAAPRTRASNGCCADAEAMPLPDASVDLVFSNLMLPWCEDIDAVFAEVARVLKPRRPLHFHDSRPRYARGTARGMANSRRSRRTCIRSPTCTTSATGSCARASPSRCSTFRRYTLTYPDVGALMRDLKATGAQNATNRTRARAHRPQARCARWQKPTKSSARTARFRRARSRVRPGLGRARTR